MLIIATFIVIFALLASGLLLLFYREAMIKRISEVINPAPKQRSLIETIQQTGTSLGGMVEHFEQVMPKSQAEVSVAQQRMVRAGFRDEQATKVLYGAKFLLPVALLAVAFLTGLVAKSPIIAIAIALGLGYLIPDFYLGHKITKRQRAIHKGLADVLDMLVICIEAGLSLDQATTRTAEELKKAQPELSDELGVVVLEQRAGRPRAEAWKRMADRTGVDSVRNLVSMLVQSEQLGTSVAKTMRVHGDTLRTQRVQQVEEEAAKTSVKLVFPLVFFIFPSLFVVLLGPAVLIMIDSYHDLIK
ncbi:MAG TPA: type II secretion system F family protein [Terracidiphilus sp.]|nr:type II secretion system F family protein [Terracidiphilus sp.]